jgi:hypothetical protein
VRLNGEWIFVPDDAVVIEPNKFESLRQACSWSSKTLASLRSGVSKPSVNLA